MKENRIFAFLEQYFVPVASKVGSQRHLIAIRDGFIAIMPLVLIGSLAVLVNNLPIDAFQKAMTGMFGDTWKSLGGNIWTGSFAILSLLLVVSVSYSLARSYQVDGLSAALIGFGCLIILSPNVKGAWGLDFAWLGSQGLFVSILTAIIATEIFRALIQRRITIKMPSGVPDAVSRSFAALIPALVVFLVFGIIQMIFTKYGTSAHALVFQTIQKPLQGLSNTLPSAILVAFLIHLLWFFGLHGTNILGPILDSIYLPALDHNIKLFSKGISASSHDMIIVTKPFFDVFVHMGGAGTTLALLVAVFLVGKSAQYRTVGRLSIAPGLFNINEPVLFGMPIVLNPLLFIPFLLTPIVLTVITYLAMTTGMVPRAVALVPWTMPPIISGYLVTGGAWQGAALQVFNFAIAVAMYVPFVKVADAYVSGKSKNEKTSQDDVASF